MRTKLLSLDNTVRSYPFGGLNFNACKAQLARSRPSLSTVLKAECKIYLSQLSLPIFHRIEEVIYVSFPYSQYSEARIS